MKKLIKCLAVLALVAVLVLNVTSCGNPAGNDNNSNTTEPDTTLLKSIDGTIVAKFQDEASTPTLTLFINDKGNFYRYDIHSYKKYNTGYKELISSRTEEIGTYTILTGNLTDKYISAQLSLKPTGFRLKDSDTWRGIIDGDIYCKSLYIRSNDIPCPGDFKYAFEAINGKKTQSFKRIK